MRYSKTKQRTSKSVYIAWYRVYISDFILQRCFPSRAQSAVYIHVVCAIVLCVVIKLCGAWAQDGIWWAITVITLAGIAAVVTFLSLLCYVQNSSESFQVSECAVLRAIYCVFTHLLLLPHIYASVNSMNISSSNGLSPVRRQAITWTNADISSNGPLGTNFTKIRHIYKTFHSWKCIWKYHRRNGDHFVQGELRWLMFHWTIGTKFQRNFNHKYDNFLTWKLFSMCRL